MSADGNESVTTRFEGGQEVGVDLMDKEGGLIPSLEGVITVTNMAI